jgi:hypothetical protein
MRPGRGARELLINFRALDRARNFLAVAVDAGDALERCPTTRTAVQSNGRRRSTPPAARK